MISALFGIVQVVAKVTVGCTRLAYRTAKLAFKVGKGIAKGGWRTMKKGKKLGRGVTRIVRQSRVMARDNIPTPAIVKSHLFTKAIEAATGKSTTPIKKKTVPPTSLVTESRVFTKK